MNVQAQRNYDLEAAYHEAEQRYIADNPRSQENYERACEVLPGGNTRTVLFYQPFPLTLARAEGCRVWDADGREYLDFVGEYTAGLYGHSHPVIMKAVREALDGGIVLGGQNLVEAKLARAIVDRWPAVERVRFTNSGTESNMMALVSALAATGRKKVMVFEGCYHGGVLYFRKGGSPVNAPFDFVEAPYNDPSGTKAVFAKHGPEIGAVIVEPMAGGGGCVAGTREFLHTIQDEARKCGALFILDEVMTSRLSPGGAQAIFGLDPDLTTFGKYIGGGLTFGAFAGKASIMDRYDPRRPDAWPHAGTFNQNVLTMSAGLAGLTQVYTPEKAVTFNARGDKLRAALQKAADDRGLPVQVTGMGSMMTVHFNSKPIRTIVDTYSDNAVAKDLLHLDMQRRGIYMTRRGMIILSLPMGEEEFGKLEAAFAAFLDERKALLKDL